MSNLSKPNYRKTPQSTWELTRGQISVLLLTLAGAATLPAVEGCKFCISTNVNHPTEKDDKRLDMVGEDETKSITLADPGVAITLSRDPVKLTAPGTCPEPIKGDNFILHGIIQVSAASYLHDVDRTREYELPQEALPWVRMIAEPNGRVVLRSNSDQFAMMFNCENLSKHEPLSCLGTEVDPKILDAPQDAGADAEGGADADGGIPDGSAPDADAGLDPDASANSDAATGDAGTDAGDAAVEIQPTVEQIDKDTFLKLLNAERKKAKAKPVAYGECADKMATYWATNPDALAGDGHTSGNDSLETRTTAFQCNGPAIENVDRPIDFDMVRLFTEWKDDQNTLAQMVRKDIKAIGLVCVSGTRGSTGRFCVLNGTK